MGNRTPLPPLRGGLDISTESGGSARASLYHRLISPAPPGPFLTANLSGTSGALPRRAFLHRSRHRYATCEFFQKYASAAASPLPSKYAFTIPMTVS